MGQIFQVKPVKKYKAGYPKKGFFRRSFVCAVPLKLFSFFIVGLLFFITVPGCNEEKLSGVTVPDHDTEVSDTDTTEMHDDVNPDDDTLPLDDDILPDVETNDFDELDGLPQPECMKDEDCEEGYYCDLNSYTCEMELAGEPVAECYSNEDCEDGFYCDLTTYTCEEELLGDPVPECTKDEDCEEEGYYCDTETFTCVMEELQGVDEPEIIPDEDSQEVPDDMMGFAPPEIK